MLVLLLTMKIKNSHIWLTLLLILLFFDYSVAQRTENDKLRIQKLRLQLLKETNDTSKVTLLIALGSVYSEGEPEQDSCLKEAYDLSKKYKFRYGMAYGLYYEGLLLSRIGKGMKHWKSLKPVLIF